MCDSNINSESLQQLFGDYKFEGKEVSKPSETKSAIGTVIRWITIIVLVIVGIILFQQVLVIVSGASKAQYGMTMKPTVQYTPTTPNIPSTPSTPTMVQSNYAKVDSGCGTPHAYYQNAPNHVQPNTQTKKNHADKEFYGYVNVGGRRVALEHPYQVDNGALPPLWFDNTGKENQHVEHLQWTHSEALQSLHPNLNGIPFSVYN